LWRIDLRSSAPDAPAFDALLTQLAGEEQARCLRRVTPALRYRFAAAHAALQSILSAETGELRIALKRDAQGKPYLPGHNGSFNMAHSGDMAVIALCEAGPVGVDIEEIRPLPELSRMAALACSAREAARLAQSADETARTHEFLRYWTRKEAVLKATGEGLRGQLRAVETANAPWAILEGEEPRKFYIETWEEPGFVGAVACANRISALNMQHFDWD
jgi:4'-phosphopantetheinyl transferase